MGLFKKGRLSEPPSFLAEADDLIYNLPDIFVPDLTEHIKEIYYEKRYAEFMEVTLVVKINGDLYFRNFSTIKSHEERFWYCMCYLKYKSSSTQIYQKCLDFVDNYRMSDDMRVEFLKLILKS